jgi:predicted dehydrogenase
MTRLKVAVVGAGIGASHIEAYQDLPDLYEVAALCDIDPRRGGEVQAKYRIPALDLTYDATLARDVDLIDICTPAALHFPQATQALEAGFDVVVEKPVARSLAEIDALAATAARAQKRISPIFQYRFGHGIQKLHHLIARGLAGRPLMATAETHWLRLDPYYQAAKWRGTWDGETGGTFASHAIHIHDLLCEVMGTPVSLHARATNRQNRNQTEDTGTLSLEFASGAYATSSITLGSRQQMSRLRFVFDGLVAESGLSPYNPGHEPWSFPSDDPADAARIAAALADFHPLPERFQGQFQRLHAALTQGAPLPVTLDDARRSIELLTAVYWSSRSGQAVALPLPHDHPFYQGWIPTMKEHGFG